LTTKTPLNRINASQEDDGLRGMATNEIRDMY